MGPSERILVFIPMYNCERQIPRVLARFTEEAQRLFAEVLVVDNRSTDGSVRAAAAALEGLKYVNGAVAVNERNYNLGGSHKVAFDYALKSGFDYCIVLHGDDQADISDLVPRLIAGEHRMYDSLLGSRFMRGSKLVGYSMFRTLGNRVFNAVFSLAARRPLHDLGSGLNIYKVSYLRSRFYRNFPNALTFNNYMLLAGVALRSRFGFFPITWREEDQRSNVKMVRQAFKTLGIAWGYLRSAGAYLERDHSGTPDAAYRTNMVERVVAGAPVPGESAAAFTVRG